MDKSDIYRTIIVGFAGFTILVYDHIITFSDEVEYIWKKRKGTIGWLFLFNRYVIPLGFIVNLFAYQWPNWSEKSCQTFVRYEGVMTVIGINVASLIMLFRVRALYMRDRFVVGLVVMLLAVELGVNVFLLFRAQDVPHIVPNAPCTMIFSIKKKPLSSGSAWLPLLYDTVVFILTLYRTVEIRAGKKPAARSSILSTLRAEGLMYYTAICAINLTLTIMIDAADQGTQNIAAQLELLITVTMISRITIDLRKFGEKDKQPETVATFTEPIFRQFAFRYDPRAGAGSLLQGEILPRVGRDVESIGDVVHSHVQFARPLTPCPNARYQAQVRNADKFEDEWIEIAGLPPPARLRC